MKNSVIGIIGGMGPQASCELYKLLIEKSISSYGAKQDQDFPEIIINSVPVPDIISDKDAYKKTLEMLRSRFRKINTYNLNSLSIACNTAHLFAADSKKELGNKFVSLIETVAKEVRKQRIQKIGILGTPVTIETKLYQDELARNGVKSVIPSKNNLARLEKIIRNVLSGKSNKADILELVKIADTLKKRGAEGIILGCTELPLVFPKKFNLPIFDSLDILADALLKRYYKYKLL